MGWFKKLRRNRVGSRPFPHEWRAWIELHVPFFRYLDRLERERLFACVQILCGEKYFIGAGGLEIEPHMPVVISAAAARLVLHLDVGYYDRVTEIILYPGGFTNPLDQEDREGEAHDWGVVVLAWDAVLSGLADPHDCYNPVFHEFAHVLDRAEGAFNGTPPLHSPRDFDTWAKVMATEFEKLRALEGSGQHVLDDYAAENEAEFFAVATETFFEDPAALAKCSPEVFRELVRFYRTDPRSGGRWVPGAAGFE